MLAGAEPPFVPEFHCFSAISVHVAGGLYVAAIASGYAASLLRVSTSMDDRPACCGPQIVPVVAEWQPTIPWITDVPPSDRLSVVAVPVRPLLYAGGGSPPSASRSCRCLLRSPELPSHAGFVAAVLC